MTTTSMHESRLAARPASRWRTAVIAVGCAISLSACGAQDAGSPTGAAGAGGLVTVRYQDAGPQFPQIPLYLAAAEGWFAEEGVDLQMNPPVFSASGILQTLVTGDADITYSGATAVLSLVQAGRDVRAFAAPNDRAIDQIVLTDEATERLRLNGITAQSPVEVRFQALRGMVIAAPPAGSHSQALLRYGVGSFGLNADTDLTIQPLPDSAAIIAAVREGNVDGAMGSAGWTVPLEVGGSGRIFIDYATDLGDVARMPMLVLTSSSTYLAENKGEAVTRFLRAVGRANEAIRAGLTPEQRQKLRSAYFPTMSDAVFDRSLEVVTPTVAASLVPYEAGFPTLVRTYNIGAERPFGGSFAEIFDTAAAERAGRTG